MLRNALLVPLLLAGCISPPPERLVDPDSPDADSTLTDTPVRRDDGTSASDAGDSGTSETVDLGRNDAATDMRTSDFGATDVGPGDSGIVDSGARDAGMDAAVDMAPPRYRVPITIPAGTVSERVESFPLLVDFTVPDIPSGRPATGDLSFSDTQGNALPWDLESYDASGNLRAWVLVPALLPNAAWTFYLDFENRPNTPEKVWGDYSAVWHFVEPDQAGQYRDASGNNVRLSPVGSPSVVAGQIGNGVEFDGLGSHLSAPGSSLEPANFTISMWAQVPDSLLDFTLVTKTITTSAGESYQFGAEAPGAWFEITYAGSLYQRYPFPYPKATWFHIAFKFDGSTMWWMVDGTRGTYAMPVSGDIRYDGGPLLLGADADLGVPDDFLNGRIDEVRIAPVAFPDERIDAERRNQTQPSDFFTIGAVEQY